MSRFCIQNINYRPGFDVVSIAVRALDGPFKGNLHDLYSTQTALEGLRLKRDNATAAASIDALAGAVSSGWSDADVLEATSAMLDTLGATLVEVCPHGIPLDEPCAQCEREAEVVLVPTPPDQLAPIGG